MAEVRSRAGSAPASERTLGVFPEFAVSLR